MSKKTISKSAVRKSSANRKIRPGVRKTGTSAPLLSGPEFLAALETAGIEVEAGLVSVALVEPSLREIDRDPPFVVSIDGYVMTGHKKLEKLLRQQTTGQLSIQLVHLSARELLQRAGIPQPPTAKLPASRRKPSKRKGA